MVISESVTRDILTHHLSAFGSNNLDEILKDYTEKSELLTQNGPLKGLTEIRQFFAYYFAVIPTGSAFEIYQITVTGNVAYVAWASDSAVAKIPMGTDSFFWEGDKIRFHTVADYRIIK